MPIAGKTSYSVPGYLLRSAAALRYAGSSYRTPSYLLSTSYFSSPFTSTIEIQYSTFLYPLFHSPFFNSSFFISLLTYHSKQRSYNEND